MDEQRHLRVLLPRTKSTPLTRSGAARNCAAEAWLGQPLDKLVHHNNTSHGRLGPPARRRDIGAAV